MLFINKESLIEISNDKPIKVAIKGEWKGHNNGRFKVDDEDLKSMIENFNQKKIDLVIDYEHQSLKNEKAPAAGWIKELYLENEALMAKAEFNEEAKNFIDNKQYRYLSPVFEFNAKDNKSGEFVRAKLHSVALTNTPFIDELGELIANKNNIHQNKGVKMDEKIKELESQIIALKNENSSLAEQNEALKKQNEENAKNLASSLVDNALNTGKIANSQKEWAMSYACKDLEGFKSFLDTKDTQAQTQVPKNNVFANKNNSASNSGLDVVKLMLGV
ncbi:phage protease [Campylobacter coli]|uniref:phage protease n=1 Tax=Campylobacter coli TaxID=195 RepID=UPI001BFF66E4|nr:phage protease [Campylobacter coli]